MESSLHWEVAASNMAFDNGTPGAYWTAATIGAFNGCRTVIRECRTRVEPLRYCLRRLQIFVDDLLWFFIAQGLLHARSEVDGIWREVLIVACVQVTLVNDQVILLLMRLIEGIGRWKKQCSQGCR